MSDYKPKVGDRVRVVLEGDTVGVLDAGFELGDGWEITYPDLAVISVEKIGLSLPTAVGAIITADWGGEEAWTYVLSPVGWLVLAGEGDTTKCGSPVHGPESLILRAVVFPGYGS